MLASVFEKPIQSYFNYQVTNKLVHVIIDDVFILFFTSLLDTGGS